MMTSELTPRLESYVRDSKRRWSFTLEAGHGTTYSHGKPVLYGHSTYERTSVLAGRPLRQWIEGWDTWEEARKEIAELKKAVKGFRVKDYGPTGPSTHIPIEELTSHLPDDTDY